MGKPSEKCKGFVISQNIEESFTSLFLHQKWQGSVMELGCAPCHCRFSFCFALKKPHIFRELHVVVWKLLQMSQTKFIIMLMWKVGLYRNTSLPLKKHVMLVQWYWYWAPKDTKVRVWAEYTLPTEKLLLSIFGELSVLAWIKTDF